MTNRPPEPTPLRFETVACDVCGADDPQPVHVLRDLIAGTTDEAFHLVRCRQCGLHYLNPRPAISELGRFYPENYAPFTRRGIAARVRAWQHRRDVAALWPYLAPPARVLDVGCATGELLQIIREQGNPFVTGIEPSPQAADIARTRWGLDVITGDLQVAALPSESVDVALLSHVIEHVPSPSETIAELRRVLRPDGTLILWLPNLDSAAARVWGTSWIGFDAPRHLYTFSVDTLGALLEKHRFVIRSVHHEWIGLEWSWGLRLRLRQQFGAGPVDRLLTRMHPILTGAFTPVAAAAAVAKRAGRIRVIAHPHAPDRLRTPISLHRTAHSGDNGPTQLRNRTCGTRASAEGTASWLSRTQMLSGRSSPRRFTTLPSIAPSAISALSGTSPSNRIDSTSGSGRARPTAGRSRWPVSPGVSGATPRHGG